MDSMQRQIGVLRQAGEGQVTVSGWATLGHLATFGGLGFQRVFVSLTDEAFYCSFADPPQTMRIPLPAIELRPVEDEPPRLHEVLSLRLQPGPWTVTVVRGDASTVTTTSFLRLPDLTLPADSRLRETLLARVRVVAAPRRAA